MRRRIIFFAAVCSPNAACIGHSLPDPHDAASQYAGAAERGDADAMYAMMSSDARKSMSRSDVASVMRSEHAELLDQGRAMSDRDARVEAEARLRFADGEEAALDLRGGRFYVTAAGALPGGGRTPEEALEQLRRVLARRSYAGLMRVVSAATRAAIERDLRSFVDGLAASDSLHVQVNGDVATVSVPGGHHVRLKRESGVWRVDDFD